MGIVPPPTPQLPSPQSVPHPQLESVLGTQRLSQQLSPRTGSPMGNPGIGLMPMLGSSQTVPAVPQAQEPEMQLGALAPQTFPHAPQFVASEVTSTQDPPQQAWPEPQEAPLPPQPQTPATQLSPSPQALPTEPQFMGSL